MAYTETEENLEEWNREQMRTCLKGYAWMVADCDFDGDCDSCQVPDAPIVSDIKSKGERTK